MKLFQITLLTSGVIAVGPVALFHGINDSCP